jgi:CHAT domain-containing protein
LIFGRDVSFATLPIHAIPMAGETLLDQHDVFYVPSLSVWGALTQRERCGGSGTALIGAADELAPHIQTELETVSRQRETPILASREEFESRAADAKYLHIAAHGILREDQPMFNAMKIGDDGWTVFDVLHLSLQAELCVLSGCSTGVSLLDDTFAAQGFIEALLAAGCQGVLASGWDTADEPNAAFMATFYEVLPSRTILEAYREASRQTREVWPNPGDWAPFALYGAFS